MDWVTSEQGLIALRAPWTALIEAGGATSPFQSWSTVYHAWKMSETSVAPAVGVARDGAGTASGILAFGRRTWRRGPFRWCALESIGPRRLDFVDALVPAAHARGFVQELVEELAVRWACWDELHLRHVRADAMLLKHIEHVLLPSCIKVAVSPVNENMAITIPAQASSWEDVCGGETRRSTRRILRRLESEGFVTERVGNGYPRTRAVDALVALHARRRAEQGQKSRLLEVDRDRLYAFVDAVVADGGDLYVLQRDETIVATQLTLRLGARVSHYRLAFDSGYRRFSPGIGLLATAVGDAVRSGAREYDFGFGVEEYKRRWSNLRRAVHRVDIDNRHAGRLARRTWTFLTTRSRGSRRRAEDDGKHSD